MAEQAGVSMSILQEDASSSPGHPIYRGKVAAIRGGQIVLLLPDGTKQEFYMSATAWRRAPKEKYKMGDVVEILSDDEVLEKKAITRFLSINGKQLDENGYFVKSEEEHEPDTQKLTQIDSTSEEKDDKKEHVVEETLSQPEPTKISLETEKAISDEQEENDLPVDQEESSLVLSDDKIIEDEGDLSYDLHYRKVAVLARRDMDPAHQSFIFYVRLPKFKVRSNQKPKDS